MYEKVTHKSDLWMNFTQLCVFYARLSQSDSADFTSTGFVIQLFLCKTQTPGMF